MQKCRDAALLARVADGARHQIRLRNYGGRETAQYKDLQYMYIHH